MKSRIVILLFPIIVAACSNSEPKQTTQKEARPEKAETVANAKVEQVIHAFKKLATLNSDDDFTEVLQVLQQNQYVPVILTDDKHNIISHKNTEKIKGYSENDLALAVAEMDKLNDPIEVEVAEGKNNYIHYCRPGQL